MGCEPKQCLLLQRLPFNGGVGQGKEWGSAGKLPALKLFRPGIGRGSREVRWSLGTLRAQGGAEVSELASRKGRGWGLGPEGSVRLRRREGGGGVRWRLWNWICSG